MGDVEVRQAVSSEDRAACVDVRMRVFVEEQEISQELELDDLEEKCMHYLAVRDNQPLGTARLYFTDEGIAKAQRVAVLASARRLGVGRALMAALHNEAAKQGHREIQLGGQLSAIPFYESVGYAAFGPEFDDAGIPHRMMRRTLS